jgi:hypothetical protein
LPGEKKKENKREVIAIDDLSTWKEALGKKSNYPLTPTPQT